MTSLQQLFAGQYVPEKLGICFRLALAWESGDDNPLWLKEYDTELIQGVALALRLYCEGLTGELINTLDAGCVDVECFWALNAQTICEILDLPTPYWLRDIYPDPAFWLYIGVPALHAELQRRFIQERRRGIVL